MSGYCFRPPPLVERKLPMLSQSVLPAVEIAPLPDGRERLVNGSEVLGVFTRRDLAERTKKFLQGGQV